MADSGGTETVDGVHKRRYNNELNTQIYKAIEQQKNTRITSRISRRETVKTGYIYTRGMHILCGVAGKWGGAKHLREWKTHGGNADITRVTKYADQKTHKP